jgi:predicted PurR-regulated permease PerM
MSETEFDGSHAPSRIERGVGTAVLLLLLIGCFLVMQPFLTALAWAFVLVFSLWPLQRRLTTRLRGRRTLAAMVMTTAIAVVLVLPTLLIVVQLADDARAIGGATKEWVASGPPAPPAWVRRLPLVGRPVATYWQDLADDAARLLNRTPSPDGEVPMGQTKLGQALAALFAWGRTWVPAAGLAIVNGVAQIILSVLLTFFIFRDGEALADRLNVTVRRIAGERGTRLTEVAGSTVRGVVYGILGTAFVQGTMAGVGFLIAGVPGAVLLGFLTFILSAVPIGPPLVWVPAALWLFHRGQTGWGVFMIIWGLAVSTVDNVVKPLIISRGSATPFILILFGVLGGALAFGFIGVFLGPTLLAVAYSLVEAWTRGATDGVAVVSERPVPT